MDHFRYQNGELCCESLRATELADRFGTPLYVYSAATLREHVSRLGAAFAPLAPKLCYAVKANGNLHLLKLLAALGCGMDVVSIGELERGFVAGVPLDRIVFAGVGKGEHEIRAALSPAHSTLKGWLHPQEPGFAARLAARGAVSCFNAESEQELELIAKVAEELGVPARAALRINPDVDAYTHAYTTTGKADNKFGVTIDRAIALFDRFGVRSRSGPHLRLDGLHVHLGSPIYTTKPYVDAIQKLLVLDGELRARGHEIRSFDIGGGFAADYETGKTPAYDVYAAAIVPLLMPLVQRGVQIVMEPGRTIVANAGVLLTRVRYTKHNGGKHFAVCDAGMNALIRPALYEAFHFMWPAKVSPELTPPARRSDLDMPGLNPLDVVGPICETGDFLAQDRRLPRINPGDVISVFGAGAYGMSMASNYNDQPLPAEVLVDGDRALVVRERQTIAELLGAEFGTAGR